MNLSSVFYSVGLFCFAAFSILLAYVGVKKYAFAANKNKSKDLSPFEIKLSILAFLLLVLGLILFFAGVIAEVG